MYNIQKYMGWRDKGVLIVCVWHVPVTRDTRKKNQPALEN
jgi:hypothetical protein